MVITVCRTTAYCVRRQAWNLTLVIAPSVRCCTAESRAGNGAGAADGIGLEGRLATGVVGKHAVSSVNGVEGGFALGPKWQYNFIQNN